MYRIQPERAHVLVEPESGLRCDQFRGIAQSYEFRRRGAGRGNEIYLLDQRALSVFSAKHDGAAGSVVDEPAAVAARKTCLGSVRVRPELMQVVVAVAIDLHATHEEKPE